MLLFTTLLFIFSIVFGSELCKEKEWFDDITNKCQMCKVCPSTSREMAPCLDFSDTVCMDIKEIRRFLASNMEMMQKANRPPKSWHETEGADDQDNSLALDLATRKVLDQHQDEKFMWNQAVIVLLGVIFVVTSSVVVILLLKFFGRSRNENRKAVNRARLFSRDRLNTTEYMNNLATLDRRLAIDEILEKRKRAIFEPQLLNENIYSDEVFVDISGLPRTTGVDHHDYEELDHRKCLLQMHQ